MAKPPRLRPAQNVTPDPRVLSTTAMKAHSGPLPAPEDLARYDQLLPGTAERIIAMAELEQNHRVSMERDAMEADHIHRNEVMTAQQKNARSVFRSDMVGQLLGGAIALGCVAGAIVSVLQGAHPTVAIAFVSLPVVGIIKAVRNFFPSKEKA